MTGYNDLYSRLFKDDDFVQRINELFKNNFYTTTHQVGGDTILEKREKIANTLKQILTTRKELTKIPERYDLIYKKFEDVNDDYKNKKKQLDSVLVNSFKETDMKKFNKKNIRLKKKLQAFTDSLNQAKSSQLSIGLGRNVDGVIMKNAATSYELVLVENTELLHPEKYKISSSDPTSEENTIYFLAISAGPNSIDNLVLQITNKQCICEGTGCDISNIVVSAQPNNMQQFFYNVKIKNNNTYNKHIKLSGNHKPEHLLSEADSSIIYPFYIICPFSIPGYCIAHKNNRVYLQPVRNDPFQQFTKVPSSSFCEISNN
jgi:hypothetical protein